MHHSTILSLAERAATADGVDAVVDVLDTGFFVRDRPDRASPRATKKAGDLPARKDQPSVVNVTRRIQLHCLKIQRPS